MILCNTSAPNTWVESYYLCPKANCMKRFSMKSCRVLLKCWDVFCEERLQAFH